MELHCYTLEHFTNFNAEHAGCGKPLVPINNANDFCPFCGKNLPRFNTHLHSHNTHLVNNGDHIGSKNILDHYMEFCQENKFHPIGEY